MQQHGRQYFACKPPLTLGLGSKCQNSTLAEHGHVTYQIKGNHECSNMIVNILPTFLVSLKTKLAITHAIAIKLKENRMQF